jgi:hypothetical protein
MRTLKHHFPRDFVAGRAFDPDTRLLFPPSYCRGFTVAERKSELGRQAFNILAISNKLLHRFGALSGAIQCPLARVEGHAAKVVSRKDDCKRSN